MAYCLPKVIMLLLNIKFYFREFLWVGRNLSRNFDTNFLYMVHNPILFLSLLIEALRKIDICKFKFLLKHFKIRLQCIGCGVQKNNT